MDGTDALDEGQWRIKYSGDGLCIEDGRVSFRIEEIGFVPVKVWTLQVAS